MTDAPDPLDPKLLRLLEAEQTRPGPTPDEMNHVFERLKASVGGGGFDDGNEGGSGADGGAPGPTGADVGSLASSLSKPLAVAIFAGGIAVGGVGHAVLFGGGPDAAPSTPSRAIGAAEARPSSEPRAAVLHDAAPRAEATAVPGLAPPATAPRHRAPEPVAPPTADRGARDRALGEENALIMRAQSALARGQADGALGALAEHARRFPDGQLTEERNALRARALALRARGDGGAGGP